MDEINAEALESLMDLKIKIEVKGAVLTGQVVSVDGTFVRMKLWKNGKYSAVRRINIDDIDAIMIASHGKPVDY